MHSNQFVLLRIHSYHIKTANTIKENIYLKTLTVQNMSVAALLQHTHFEGNTKAQILD